MASEYSVNISLNTKKAEDGLKNLKKGIDDLTKTNLGTSKKTQKTEAEILNSKRAQQDMMSKTRRIGDLVQKQADKGLKVGRAQEAVAKSALLNQKKDFAGSEKLIKIALRELQIQKSISKEIAQQASIKSKSKVAASSNAGLLTGFGPTSPVFGRATQMTSAGNIASILQDPTTSVSPVQQALAKMEERSARDRKQAVLNRKKSLSLGKNIVTLKTREANLDAKRAESLAKETQLEQKRERLQANRLLLSESTAQGAFSRLSDRQSRDVSGNRTFMNNPFAGFMGRRFGTTRGFDTQSAFISGGFPLLFGQGPVGAAAGALGGGIGGMFGQMGGFAGGIAATAIVQQLSNVVNGVKELAESITTLDGQFNLLTEKSLFSTKEAENRAKVLQSLGEREKLATLISQELANVLGQDGADKLRRAGEASKELNKTIAELTINLQLALAGPIAQFLKLVNQVLDQGTSISLGQGKGTVNLGPGEEQFLKDFGGVLSQMSQSQIDNILRAQIGTSVEGLRINNERRQAIRKFDLARQANPAGLDAFMGGGSSFAGGKTPIEVDAARVASAQKKVKAMQKEVEFSKLVVEEGLKEADIQKQIQSITENLNEEELKLLDTQGLSVRALVEKNNQAKQLVENARMIEQSFKSLTQNISTDLAQGIQGLIRGTSTLNDVLNNVLNKMIDAAFNMAFFGNAGGTLTKGLGLFGSLFSGFLANGGPAKAGRSYIVGEKGPELFTPGVSGMVSPTSSLGGSTNIVVNVDASGSNVEGDEEEGRQLGIALSAAIESELIKQKRPGGLLA